MNSKFLGSNTIGKNISKKATRDDAIIELELEFHGFNKDITSMYQWHLNFPYYTGKGYRALKLEDYHYFSENSQFGASMRQGKGGSIRAFQENLQQLIQLVKVHLIPLLKEIKETHFYKKWVDKIVDNDKIVQNLLKKGVSNNDPKLKSARSERNEAISHIKDKWINDVDGGKMWQMTNSQTERGLDMALLPQLFFGVTLDNPLVEYHGQGKSIKEQLDNDVYNVDISEDAKLIVARFMFRFHTWLPTLINDTNITFRLKVATLKQFYAQLEMYIDFMKPLLIEISRKTEGFEKSNFYRDFEMENPEFVNLFDISYSFIKILGIRNFDIRGPNKLEDLEFTKFGLFLKTNKDIISGSEKGKTGFILSEENFKYNFYPSEKKDINNDEFKKIIPIQINKNELKSFSVMEFDFYQRRRNDTIQTPQGTQQVPFMKNSIKYKGYCWNQFEIATYRQSLKKNNLDLLETFIGEIAVVKEDLLYYVNDLESNEFVNYDVNKKNETEIESKKNDNKNVDFNLILGPFKSLAYIFSPIIPKFNFSKLKSNNVNSNNSSNDKIHEKTKVAICEDTWKVYVVNKKAHQFMQY